MGNTDYFIFILRLSELYKFALSENFSFNFYITKTIC